MKGEKMKYRVGTFRDAGLEAKWTRNDRTGQPYIIAKIPNAIQPTWYAITPQVWREMKQYGVREGLIHYALLGDVFSLPA